MIAGHARNLSSTLLQESMKPDGEKQPCEGKETTAWKASDIASQREMPKAHGRGVTHPDRRALVGSHLLLFPMLLEEAKAGLRLCLEVISCEAFQDCRKSDVPSRPCRKSAAIAPRERVKGVLLYASNARDRKTETGGTQTRRLESTNLRTVGIPCRSAMGS